jgi:hypothetical protein
MSGGGAGMSGGALGGANGMGGSGVTPACSGYAPCGGDFLGTWRLEAVCGQMPASDTTPAACEDEVKSEMASTETDYEFSADGRVTLSTSIEQDLQLSVTDACAEARLSVDAETYCSLTGTASDAGGSSASGTPVYDCTYVAPTCSCHVTQHGTSSIKETYTSMGSQITVVDQHGTTSTVEYCVTGDTLMLRSTAASGGQITTFARK